MTDQLDVDEWYYPDFDDDVGYDGDWFHLAESIDYEKMLASSPALADTEPLGWVAEASCAGDRRFTQGPPASNAEALELQGICRACPVVLECIEFHDRHGASGVFAAGEYFEEEIAA